MSALQGGSGIGWLILGAGDLTSGVGVARPGTPDRSRCWRSHLSGWTPGVGVLLFAGNGDRVEEESFLSLPADWLWPQRCCRAVCPKEQRMELLEFKMAERCSWVLRLFGGSCSLSHSLSLNLMHKTKFNLIRKIICLINLIFNIQAEALPPQHIY